MRNTILLAISVASLLLAQPAGIPWHVVDNGGGMRSPAIGDTLWASIAQSAIGVGCGATACLCAGYIYVFEGTCLEILETQKDTKRPYSFGINSVSPNPFNPTCAIEFEIEEEGEIDFEIYNILGERVDTPLRDKPMQPGLYRITWGGNKYPSGTYFARLSSHNKTITKRVLYLK